MGRNAFSVLFLHNYYKGFTNVGGSLFSLWDRMKSEQKGGSR